MSNLVYPTTNLEQTEQLIIERGEGVYVFDDQGKPYLEGLAGLWCTALGYGNQELIDACSQQMTKLSFSHLFGGKSHPSAIQLAQQLTAMVPMENASVFFGNSGSDANDTIIKILRYYFNNIGQSQKYKIITRQRAYHGVTLGAGSLTSLPVNLQHFDAPTESLGILRTDHPHYYSGALAGEAEADFVERIVNNLEQLIIKEGADTIAAFIAEPITGASGVIVPPDGYYEKVQVLLARYNILFWADEVITGFGRTGNDFGCTTMNIQQPQLMTLAKQLSSAYFPISAALISDDIYQVVKTTSAKVGVFGHGYTYSGHPAACAVALKTLEIYQRDNIFAQANITGEYLHKKLQRFSQHPLVGEVRGKGLIAAVELRVNQNQANPASDAKLGSFAQQSCQQHGLLLRTVAGNSLAICPPLIITEPQIDELVDKLALALDDTLSYAQQQGLSSKG